MAYVKMDGSDWELSGHATDKWMEMGGLVSDRWAAKLNGDRWLNYGAWVATV